MAQTGDALVDIELDSSAGGAAETSSSTSVNDINSGSNSSVVIEEAINVGEGEQTNNILGIFLNFNVTEC